MPDLAFEIDIELRLTADGTEFVRAVLAGLFDLRQPGEPPTSFELWRRKAPLCPVCTHRSRLVERLDVMAWRCRWGHVILDENLNHGESR